MNISQPAGCPYYEKGSEIYLQQWEKNLAILLYSILAVLAALGNFMVCWIVFRMPRMQSATNYLIANLAVSDILMAAACIPFSYWHILVLQYWPFGEILCPVIIYIQAVAILVSAHTLIMISIDRFLAIIRPMQHSWTTFQGAVIVAMVWVADMLIASPILVVQRIQPLPAEDGSNGSIIHCTELWSHTHAYAYSLVLMTLQYFLPLVILLLTYGGIGFKLAISHVPGESSQTGEKARRDSIVRLVLMMMVVSTSYTLCWLPQNTFNVIWTKCARIAYHPYILYIWWGCHFVAMAHSCVNPVIYYFSSQKFRSGYFAILNCLAPKICMREASRKYQGSQKTLTTMNSLPITMRSTMRMKKPNEADYSPIPGENMKRRHTEFHSKPKVMKTLTTLTVAPNSPSYDTKAPPERAERIDVVSAMPQYDLDTKKIMI